MKRLGTQLILASVILMVISLLTGQSSAKIDPETCVGMWLFDKDKENTVKDSSGNGNDGVFFVKARWDKGKFGNALLFNGSTDYVKTNKQLINPLTGTIMLWFRADNPTRSDQHLIYVGAPVEGDGWCGVTEFHLSFRAGGPLNFYDCSAGAGLWDIKALVPPVKGQWYHGAVTWKVEGFARLYVDGVLAGKQEPIPKFVFETWQDTDYMGRPFASTRFFEGAMDEVAIFNEALEENDIKTIMNQGIEKALGITAVSPAGKLATTWGSIKKQ